MDGRMGQEAASRAVTASSVVAGVVESGLIKAPKGSRGTIQISVQQKVDCSLPLERPTMLAGSTNLSRL